MSANGVGTDPEKIKCIADWPVPTCPKELKQFLGLASYYRRFVKGFSQLASPLYALCSDAFLELKKRLMTSPVLTLPRFNLDFILDTDASSEGLGAVLSQVIDGREHVIAYASRVLSKSERKYCATRREMLALVWAARHFRPYLMAGDLHSAQIIIPFIGCTTSRNQRVRWHGGWSCFQNLTIL